MRRLRIDAARVRHTSVGSSCVPKTAISPGATPPCRSVAYVESAAKPLPTIAQRMVQSKVHGVRPEERRRRRTPLLDPRLVAVRTQQMVVRLLRKVPVRLRVRLDPRKACARVVDAAVVDVREPEHRRQEQPLAAAVVLVVEVAVDAAVDEEVGLDAGDDLLRADEEQRAIEAIVRARERLALDLVGLQAVPDAPERRRVDPLALLPRVEAWLVPVMLEPARDERCRLVPPRLIAATAERAEEEAEAVDLQLGPVRRVGLALEAVARVPRAGRPRQHDACAPVEEPVGAVVPSRLAH